MRKKQRWRTTVLGTASVSYFACHLSNKSCVCLSVLAKGRRTAIISSCLRYTNIDFSCYEPREGRFASKNKTKNVSKVITLTDCWLAGWLASWLVEGLSCGVKATTAICHA